MLFNSFNFLFFFIIVTSLYFLLPQKYRTFMLLCASCMFYMAFIPVYILILFITILIDYFAGIWIENSNGKLKKFYLVFSILSTCLVLFVFKYYNFFNSSFVSIFSYFGLTYPIKLANIVLPIGLSFHTFQSLSYVIEVYRNKQKAEKNFLVYALYVMFYPQLVAGPIERPQNLLHQFYEKHPFDYNKVVEGLKLILWGMFMKVVIADRLKIYVDGVYNNVSNYSAPSYILATYFFAFEIYCDFAGYSNIAIGTAKVMGFKLMTNFNRPYFAKSISEFWHRWHISLSTWFKDYLYIPLGGNRLSKNRWFFNLFIVFLVSGLWHGANWTFVIWGALHGMYIIIGLISTSFRKKVTNDFKLNNYPKTHNVLKMIIVFNLVCLGWVFFRANSLQDAIMILQKIFTFNWSLKSLDIGSTRHFAYSILAILFLVFCEFRQRTKDVVLWLTPKSTIKRWAMYIILLLAIIIAGVFDGGEFIYFQF